MNQLAARLLNFRQGEMPLALLAALFYFCVLCGYFFLRPVREAMGVSRGMGDLRWLFIGTSFASLAFVLCSDTPVIPQSGASASRSSTRPC